MTAHATWFGPEAASLLGFVHIPEDGLARGAVVLCPPLGQEHIDSYRGVVLAAQQLCAAGVVAVRFDYEGTGDSAGAQLAPDAVERWIRSIVTAVQLARATGVQCVSLAGLRAGALLAAAAADRCGPLNSVALWDPVVNGRAYLRQQTTLYRMSVGADREQDGAVSIPAGVLAAETAKALGSLRLSAFASTLALQPLLCAVREGAQSDPVLCELIDGGSTHLSLDRQEEFLERPSSHFRIPSRSIQQITTWLSASFPPDKLPVAVPVLRERARVACTSDGRPVVETLRRSGPDALFAIETGVLHSRSSLVLYSPAKEHRVGPARMHVELARTLAEASVQTIRFDRRGTGDSGVVAWDELTPMYSAESVVDAANVLDLVRSAPAETTVVGLCAGAWLAVNVALRHDAGSIVMLSPIIWALQTRDRKVAAAQLTLDRTEAENARLSRRQRIKDTLRRRLPYVLWRWLGGRGVTQVPEVTLSALLRRGVQVTAVMPPADHTWFLDQRGAEGLRRLQHKGMRPELVLTENGDHSLLHRGTRQTAMATVTRVATRQPGSPTLRPRARATLDSDLDVQASSKGLGDGTGE